MERDMNYQIDEGTAEVFYDSLLFIKAMRSDFSEH